LIAARLAARLRHRERRFPIRPALRFGAVEFDGPPKALTPGVLTPTCGEEDWPATIKTVGPGEEMEAMTAKGADG
jgi:hypothetical protein